MIYFPGRNYEMYGGAETLILNIAKALKGANERIGLIGVVRYPLREILERSGIQFDFIDSETNDIICLKESDVLLVFTYTSDLLKIKGNPKVIVWSILSYSIINWNTTRIDKFIIRKFGKQIFWHVTRSLIIALTKHNALAFMDKSTMDIVSQYYKAHIKKEFLPIPITFSENLYESDFRESTIVTYLGRGNERWKIMPLLKVLKDIDLLGLQRIEVHIITSETDLFRQLLSSYSSFRVTFHTHLQGENLRQFLIKNSSLHFAMGTSALEAAILGIPTILLDYSKEMFPENYKYRWLFESEGFSLGSEVSSSSKFGNHLMSDVFDAVNSEAKRELISVKCYRYCVDNHSVGYTIARIREIDTKMRLDCFVRYFKDYYKYRMF